MPNNLNASEQELDLCDENIRAAMQLANEIYSQLAIAHALKAIALLLTDMVHPG